MTMRYIPNNIRGLQFKEQVSFAAGDPGGDYTALKAFDIQFTPEVNMIQPGYQKPEGCTGPDAAIAAGEGGTLTFKTYLRGGAGSESEFSVLAKNMGLDRNSHSEHLTLVTAGGNDSVSVNEASMAEITGDGILVDGGSTAAQIRFISSKTGSSPVVFTTEPNWATNPSNGDDVNKLDTFTPDGANLGEPTKYMAFKVLDGDGATNIHQFVLTGCAGTFKINSVTPNALPVVEWTYMVDAWAASEATVADTADAFEPAKPALGCPCYIDDTELKIREFSFDPGIKVVPLETTTGAQGRSGWLYHSHEPKLEFSTLWDTAWLTKWQANTEFQFMFEQIDDVDEAWALYVPACQVLNPAPEDVNEHRGNKVEVLIVDPGFSADATPLRIPMWSIAITGSGT